MLNRANQTAKTSFRKKDPDYAMAFDVAKKTALGERIHGSVVLKIDHRRFLLFGRFFDIVRFRVI